MNIEAFGLMLHVNVSVSINVHYLFIICTFYNISDIHPSLAFEYFMESVKITYNSTPYVIGASFRGRTNCNKFRSCYD